MQPQRILKQIMSDTRESTYNLYARTQL